MTRNPIGLLETALQICTAKTNHTRKVSVTVGGLVVYDMMWDGCDGGDCSCGEDEDCLASGWEKFVPPLKPQTEQPAQQQPKKPIP